MIPAAIPADTPGIRRRNYKWAMVGHKSGRCVGCDLRVTEGNIGNFHFDHKVPVQNCNDKADRWGGGIRDWPPFTEQWFVWASRVDLICEACHMSRHRPDRQLSMSDFLSVQERLDNYDPGSPLTSQHNLTLTREGK